MRRMTCYGAVLAFASVLAGCTTTETTYTRASRLDTIAAYQAALKENPSGPEAEAAKARVADLEDEATFRNVAHRNTPEAYRDFAARHPASKNAEEATRRSAGSDEDALLWTVGIGSKSAYEGFATSYPQSTYLVEVQARIRWMETAKIGFAVEGVSDQEIRAAFGSMGPDSRILLLPYGAPVDGTGVSVVIDARFVRSKSKTRLASDPPEAAVKTCLVLLGVGMLFPPAALVGVPCAAGVIVAREGSTTTIAENWEATIRLGDLSPGVAYSRHVPLDTMTGVLTEGRHAAYVNEGDFIVWLVNHPVLPMGLARAALKRGDSHFRLAIVEALTRRTAPAPNESVIPALSVAVVDSDDHIRGKAAEALGRSHDPAALDPLVTALRDNAFLVRAAAAAALGELRDRRVIGPLLAALKQDEMPIVRGEATKALGRSGDLEALDQLVKAQTDDAAGVRAAAAAALGELRDERAIEPLVAALKPDELSFVRAAVAKALTTITGQDFGEDQAKWQAWWEQHRDKVQAP